jgi:hypothetical protein
VLRKATRENITLVYNIQHMNSLEHLCLLTSPLLIPLYPGFRPSMCKDCIRYCKPQKWRKYLKLMTMADSDCGPSSMNSSQVAAALQLQSAAVADGVQRCDGGVACCDCSRVPLQPDALAAGQICLWLQAQSRRLAKDEMEQRPSLAATTARVTLQIYT